MPEIEQPLAQLQQAIRDAVPSGVLVHGITALSSGALLVSLLPEGPMSLEDRLAVGGRIVEVARVGGGRAFPLWVQGDAPLAGFEAIASTSDVRRRRLLIRGLRRAAALVAKAKADELKMDWAELSALSVAVRDTLSILCASRSKRFDASHPFASLSSVYEDPASFGEADVGLYFHFRGLAEACREARLAGQRPPRWLADDRMEALGAFESLLLRAEAEVRSHTETPSIRARRRWMKRGGFVLGLLAVAATAVAVALSLSPLPRASATPPGEVGGIVGVYYRGESFEQRVATRVDAQISFGTNGSIHPDLPPDGVSVRWRGFLHFPEGGAQYLCARADDGVRVYLGDQVAIDDWGHHGSRDACEKVRVEAGWHRLVVQYFDGRVYAAIGLSRGPTRHETVPIPPEDLCCRE